MPRAKNIITLVNAPYAGHHGGSRLFLTDWCWAVFDMEAQHATVACQKSI